MAIIDRLLPGRAKVNLRRSIDEITDAARRDTERQGLSGNTAVLWEAICSSASDMLTQLLVQNRDKEIDWGLKSHRRRITQPQLTAMYWWLLLYQLVLFKNKGVSGYSVEEEFVPLHEACREFMEYLVNSPAYDAAAPAPWDDRWRSQVSLEASLGLYNRVMEMLGLSIDPEKRVYTVSYFTYAAERIYDSNVRDKAEGRS